MDTILNFYETVTVAEQAGAKVLLKESLVLLIDDYMKNGTTLTLEQKGELAFLRGKVITGLTNF